MGELGVCIVSDTRCVTKIKGNWNQALDLFDISLCVR